MFAVSIFLFIAKLSLKYFKTAASLRRSFREQSICMRNKNKFPLPILQSFIKKKLLNLSTEPGSSNGNHLAFFLVYMRYYMHTEIKLASKMWHGLCIKDVCNSLYKPALCNMGVGNLGQTLEVTLNIVADGR